MPTTSNNIPNAGLGNYLGLTVLSAPYAIPNYHGHRYAVRVRDDFEFERFEYEQYFRDRHEAKRWLREHHAWTAPRPLA